MRRRWLAVLVVAAALAGWHASASAQQGAAPNPDSSATASKPKPGPARPAPPREESSPDFVPSETVSSGKPVSFPTDI